MIITIRGTSGSGKSTLARRIMNHYPHKTPHFIPRRKQPLYYDFHRQHPETETAEDTILRVLGHYETPTGGGDTISQGQDFIAELARKAHEEGLDCLYEGLVVSSDASRVMAMHKAGLPVMVISLNTPLKACLESVRERRAARGDLTPLNPKTTTNKHRAVYLMVDRFKAAGVPTHHVDRETGYQIVKEALKL